MRRFVIALGVFIMPAKIKILLIVSEFWQAGGERQTYEIINAINKDKFNIVILCDLPLKHDPTKHDFYFDKYIEQNIPIYFMDQFKWNEKRSYFRHLGKKIRFKKNGEEISYELCQFLKEFEKILIFGEYTFRNIQRYLNQSIIKNSFIFIHNSIKQVPKNYDGFNFNKKYNFVSGFFESDIKIELKQFTSFNHFFFPLSIDCNVQLEPRRNIEKKTTKILGVFTRLTIYKPLDLFYYALHLLNKNDEYEYKLHIYGGGCPNEFEFNKCLQYLGLENLVFFKGHSLDIRKTAIQQELDLIWSHGYYGEPGGFASYDLCLTGIPQLCWDFGGESGTQILEFPMFSTLSKFVDKTFSLLNNNYENYDLGERQKQYVIQNKNIEVNITKLESLLESNAN